MADSVMEQLTLVEKLESYKEGKKLLKEKKYGEAVDKLGEAVAELVEEHGDLGTPVAKAYFEYGNALLLQVESSSNVFGESVKHKKQTEETGESKGDQPAASSSSSSSSSAAPAEVEKESEDKPEEKSKDESSAAGDVGAPAGGFDVDAILQELINAYKSEHNEDPTEDVLKQWQESLAGADLSALMGGAAPASEAESAPKDATAAEDGDAEEEDDSKDDQAEAPAEGEEGNDSSMTADDIEEIMSIAWETMESARVIFGKVEDADHSKEVNDYVHKIMVNIYLRLGDLSMERGLFEASVEDYAKSLAKALERKEETSQDNSPHLDLADIHTHLATAHVFCSSSVDTVSEMRVHQIHSLRHYLAAMVHIAIHRQYLLKADKTGLEDIISALDEVRVDSEKAAGDDEAKANDDANDDDEDDGDAKMDSSGKEPAKTSPSKAPAKKSEEGEDPPLSSAEKSALAKAKVQLDKLLGTLPSKDDLKEEAEGAERFVIMIDELKMKVDDIYIVLENPEATRALTGSAGDVVEDAIGSASNNENENNETTSSAFDKPSSTAAKSVSAAPTNLLQVRKKAAAPSQESDESTKETSNDDKPESSETTDAGKRKAEGLAAEETAEVKRAKSESS